jgi:hypothetical protein
MSDSQIASQEISFKIPRNDSGVILNARKSVSKDKIASPTRFIGEFGFRLDSSEKDQTNRTSIHLAPIFQEISGRRENRSATTQCDSQIASQEISFKIPRNDSGVILSVQNLLFFSISTFLLDFFKK